MPSNAESEAAMELYKPAETSLATTDALPSFDSIVQAVGSGSLSAEAVEKLLAVYRELKADKAEEAYNVAFAAFQSDCPTIPRISEATIVTSSGASFKYRYANVETTMKTIGPVLKKHKLGVSFENSTVEGNMLTATCRCSHVGGHSRMSSFTVPTESTTKMSPQHKHGAAGTYAQRRALNQVLGLWTGDPDHDGGEPPAPSPLLTPEQREHIGKLGDAVGQNWDDLYRWWGIANLAEAREDKYEAAVKILEAKQQQTKGKT